MTGQPLLEPNSSRAPRSSNKKFLQRDAAPPSMQEEADVLEVARTLAAHGGGPLSFDLALDLVLNEVVDEALRATGATGAAIAFTRDGEMVCRASAGADAPELGVRLDTKSGLSGTCLQTGTIQQCDDTETDPRVSAEACRQLGVRSILILPLSVGKEPFGILQAFSPRSSAFGEAEISVLESLVRRVVANKKAAEQGPAIFERKQEPPDRAAKEREILEELGPIELADQEPSLEQAEEPKLDILTLILGGLVIIVAVLVGLLIGWRVGFFPGFQGGPAQKATAAPSSTAAPDRGHTAAQSSGSGLPQASGSQAKRSNGAGTEPPVGGLIVTENGKVIFQQPPSEPPVGQVSSGASGDSGTPTPEAALLKREVSREVSESLLIRRIEPEYPLDARTQRIQGMVILKVGVGKDGNVRDIAAVSGNPMLTQAAIAAVKQWKYHPYSIEGKPVEMQTQVIIQFTLPPS
jgi:TonB family protein